jgi:ABC-type amino acid transport substrate-binding protein
MSDSFERKRLSLFSSYGKYWNSFPYHHKEVRFMKRKRILVLAASLVAMVFSLGSCGSSSAASSAASSASSAEQESLVVGLECNYAPFNWTEAKASAYTLPISNHSGEYADGYDIQIAKLLAEDLGYQVKIVQTVWESLIPDLQTNNINCIIAGMTDTAEREQSIDFTDEYYRSELVLIVKKEVADTYTSTLTSAQFKTLVTGKNIESQVSTVTDDVIASFATNYGAVHSTPVSTFALAAMDVLNGSAFAMTAELPVANSITASMPTLGIIHIDQSILGETQAQLGVSIGLKKGSGLKDKLNASLKKITSSQRVELMTAATTRSTVA